MDPNGLVIGLMVFGFAVCTLVLFPVLLLLQLPPPGVTEKAETTETGANAPSALQETGTDEEIWEDEGGTPLKRAA